MAAPRVQADPQWWDGSGTSWNDPASWSAAADGSAAGVVPTVADLATFNITGLNDPQAISLNGDAEALGLAVNTTGAVAIQGGDANRTLSLAASGIVANAGAGALTIGSATAGQGVAVSLMANQSWTNSSGSTSAAAITVHNGVSLGVSGPRTLTLGGNTPTTLVNTVNGVVADGGGTLAVTMSGSSTARWLLAGPNTYSGLTTVTGGALRVSNSKGLGSTAAGTTVSSGGAVFLQDGITVAGEALTLNGDGPSGSAAGALQSVGGVNRWTSPITVNTGTSTGRIGAISSSTLTLDGDITATGTGQLVFQTGNSGSNSGTIVVNGDISHPGQRLTKSSTGAASGLVILNGSNNYGETIISSGTIQFGNGGTTGNLGTGPVSVAATATGTLAFRRSDDVTVANVISGAGGIAQRGTGTVTLTGANNLTGPTSVGPTGTLALDFTGLSTPANVAGTGALTLSGGRLHLIGKPTGDTTSQTFASTTLANNSGPSRLAVNSNGGAATNVALGAVTRNVGTTLDLTLPAAGAVTSTTANTGGILGGYATVGGTTWAVSAGDGTNPGAVTPLATYADDAWAAGNNTTVTANTAPASDSTTNSLRFNAAAPTNVTVAGTNVITTGGILVTPSVGANLSEISGTGTLTTGNAQGDLIVIQNNTAGGLTIGALIGNSITKSGDGLLTLTGLSGADFNTRINAGTVSVSNPSNLGGGTGITRIQFPFGSTGTLQITGSTFSSGKGITLNGNGIIDVPAAASLTSTLSATGPGSLTKVGAGVLRFTATTSANTYTGATIIDEGTIQITGLANGGTSSSVGQSSADAANLVLNGGSLRYVGTTPATTDRLFTLGPDGGTLDASATAAANTVSFTNTGPVALAGSAARTLLLTGSNSGDNSLAASLGDGAGGATSVQKSGAGSWVLAGDSTYTGGTTITAGSLTGAADGAFGAGDVTVQASAVSLVIPVGVSDAIADAATLTLAGGGAVGSADAGYASLGSGVNEFVGGLVLGITPQTDFGATYGAPGSGADHELAEYFSGPGVVTLVPEPGAAASLLAGVGLLLRRRRRNRHRSCLA